MNIKQRRDYHISAYKKRKGCAVCGYQHHPRALHWDHLDQSTKSSVTKQGYKNNAYNRNSGGGMYRLYSKKYSVKLLIQEIRKCQLLCANHHAEKTYSDCNS